MMMVCCSPWCLSEVKAYMLKPLVDCSITVYTRIAAELLPTPAKSHYTFNLRDVSKVFQVRYTCSANRFEAAELNSCGVVPSSNDSTRCDDALKA
jgi:hypothetical protein